LSLKTEGFWSGVKQALGDLLQEAKGEEVAQALLEREKFLSHFTAR